jgi:hypothetical protein
MGRTGSSNRKARQRHRVSPQELIHTQRNDGERSKAEVGHEHTICPQDLALIHIQMQHKAGLKRVKLRVPRRASMEDDDMFTMFLWSAKTMDHNEKSIEFEREKYQKTLRRDSMKKRTPISAKDIFGEEELKKGKLRLSLGRRLSSSFGYNPNPDQKTQRRGSFFGHPDQKTLRRGSFFGQIFRRASNSYRASLGSRN